MESSYEASSVMGDALMPAAGVVVNPIIAQLGVDGFEDAAEVGRGGFGVVYRCTQVELDRVVAVKVLTFDLDESRPRFEREQQAMARLTGHPNIVAVLQVGQTQDGHPYLVMPYCRAGCMQTEITRVGRLPLQEALGLGVAIAAGLESAHRLEIVHRDVKPANVLRTDYGEPANMVPSTPNNAASAAAGRRAPICSSPRCSDTITARMPAASCLRGVTVIARSS